MLSCGECGGAGRTRVPLPLWTAANCGHQSEERAILREGGGEAAAAGGWHHTLTRTYMHAHTLSPFSLIPFLSLSLSLSQDNSLLTQEALLSVQMLRREVNDMEIDIQKRLDVVICQALPALGV